MKGAPHLNLHSAAAGGRGMRSATEMEATEKWAAQTGPFSR
jgi:hypothetical protein